MTGIQSIGIIGGAGWLGGALAGALISEKILPAEAVTLSYRSEPRSRLPGISYTQDNQALIDRSDIVIVSVRPQDWPDLAISSGPRLVISVMAGIQMHRLRQVFPACRLVRAIPNAAAEVGKSYTPWLASDDVTENDRQAVRRIFEACGTCDEIQRESELDYLAGFTGTGPAFPALLVAAMMQDATRRGLNAKIARKAAAALLIGAGRLQELHDEDPAATVKAFVDYAGVTAAAIVAMQAAGLEDAVSKGLAAALSKTIELGKG